MKNSIYKAWGLSLVALLGFTACEDDLLTGQPSWLGESIYAELESRGCFTETLRLINAQDEDYASVLQKTGSKTLFVADDEAWQRFYKGNPWGITSLESMTPAQRKLIFKSNMVNSAYLVELLGNIPGETPLEGACMRRATAANLMDSVPWVPREKYPVVNEARRDKVTGEQIDYWADVRSKEGVFVLEDDGVASMIHFMPKFMMNNNITNDDVEFLTNGEVKSNSGAFVNGKVILENLKPESDRNNIRQDITCQNGYIHMLQDVALPLDNMANVIAGNPQFSIYSRLLDRFSYPHFDATVNAEYHRQYGGSLEDSIFVRRYFNNHGDADARFETTDKNVVVSTKLPYDPGWNRYRLYSSGNTTFQYDAAAMLVPTDEAMMAYLETDGADLQERFGNSGSGATAWDNAPDDVILPLLQNTMLTSLKAAVPSQFGSINNTAGETMGVVKADVDTVLWACNGVVYQTNRVYVAPEYVSVYYPCVIRANDDLHYVHAVAEMDNERVGGEGYKAYMNNMGSVYSFIIPTNNALQTYYDPVSYKRENARQVSTAVAYKFFVNENGGIAADPFLVDWTDLDEYGRGKIDEVSTNLVSLSPVTSKTAGWDGEAATAFKDILNSCLCVDTLHGAGFVPGQRFYKAKNGGPVVVEWDGNRVTGVAGSFQYERGYFIPVLETFDKSKEGNGRSYIIDQEPLMSTFTSPYSAITDTLKQDIFGSFAKLLASMDFIKSDDGASHSTMDKAIGALNNYHYTIYVPTNAAVDALTDSHKLPTWEDVDAVDNCIHEIEDKLDKVTTTEDSVRIAGDLEFMRGEMQTMKDVISNFVSYHIQDNSVYIDGEEHRNDVYESACLDTLTNRFVKLYVSYDRGGQLVVTDNCGNRRTVDSECNNILTRQYFFDASTLQNSSKIYSSSFAVIHQIDGPLVPFSTCYYSPETYNKVQEMLALYPVGGGNNEENDNPNPIKRKR